MFCVSAPDDGRLNCSSAAGDGRSRCWPVSAPPAAVRPVSGWTDEPDSKFQNKNLWLEVVNAIVAGETVAETCWRAASRRPRSKQETKLCCSRRVTKPKWSNSGRVNYGWHIREKGWGWFSGLPSSLAHRGRRRKLTEKQKWLRRGELCSGR